MFKHLMLNCYWLILLFMSINKPFNSKVILVVCFVKFEFLIFKILIPGKDDQTVNVVYSTHN